MLRSANFAKWQAPDRVQLSVAGVGWMEMDDEVFVTFQESTNWSKIASKQPMTTPEDDEEVFDWVEKRGRLARSRCGWTGSLSGNGYGRERNGCALR